MGRTIVYVCRQPGDEARESILESCGAGPGSPLPKDMDCDETIGKDSETITIHWTAAETEQLLKQTHHAYHTEINDILLTALGMAIHEWTGMGEIRENLEGHGREDILPELDITRTVGWFTSMYPVMITMESGADLSRKIKTVKEGLRNIPNQGHWLRDFEVFVTWK